MHIYPDGDEGEAFLLEVSVGWVDSGGGGVALKNLGFLFKPKKPGGGGGGGGLPPQSFLFCT